MPERKSIQQIFDDCYVQHRMEIMTKGKSLALYVTIPEALKENDYDINVLDDTVWQDFTKILSHRLAAGEADGVSSKQVAAQVIIDIQNAGLLVRRRA